MSRRPNAKIRLVLAALAVALAAVLAYARLFKSTGGGTGGNDSVNRSWDPTGSHPLPNESVERAP